jgi:hypothetical protein
LGAQPLGLALSIAENPLGFDLGIKRLLVDARSGDVPRRTPSFEYMKLGPVAGDKARTF